MKWQIPGKTFLLGEYAALNGESALLLTTSPCFTLALHKNVLPSTIHSHSPAGRFWQKNRRAGYSLQWQDPYQGLGGLGASSAQFIGAYFASNTLQNLAIQHESLLEAYYQTAWSGEGCKPSGYDVLAQLQPPNCAVYINKNEHILTNITWPFNDIAFILLHTGKKLATHQHLASSIMPADTSALSRFAEEGFSAFQETNSEKLIKAINASYHELTRLNLVAAHTLQCISELKKHKFILALKGCGALGADVILVLVPKVDLCDSLVILSKEEYCLLATSENKV
jgi:mevalonate kinase